MTLATITEAEVRAELWLSFIGVLKSYASLVVLDGESMQTTNLDDSPYGIVWSMPCRDGRLRCGLAVSYDAEKDKGHWRLHSGDAAPMSRKSDSMSLREFTLHLDGSVSLDGSVLDMDHAAIQLMAWFTKTVKTGLIEVPA